MFTKALLIGALAALATAQSSVLSFTRVPSPITAGEPQAITYATNDTASPVTIRLRKGASGNLDTIATLSDSVMNGQYIWTPSDSLENGNDYALEISQKGQVNYFGPFQIQGASGSSSSSSSSSASTSSATSASAYSSSTTSAAMLNSTRTSSSLTMMGTGMTMPSYNSTNATMTSATLSMTPTSSSSKPTNTDDLSMGGSSTGSDAPASTGAAAILGSSAIAIVFGAAVAVLMG